MTPPATTSFDAAGLDFQQQYKLLVGTVIPRPIALVTTLGPRGSNAAPFSYFNAVAQLPPMLTFSIGPKDHGVKDTLKNLQRHGECVVHIVDYALREKMNICAIDFPEGVDEIAEAGLATAPSVKVQPVRIIECPVQFECKVVNILELGKVPYHMVLCEVVYFHYRADVLNERLHVDFGRLDPIGRLSGGHYTRCTDHFSMAVPPLPEAWANGASATGAVR